MSNHSPIEAAPVSGSRPRLLDLFCGAGGAAMGYHRAGFDVMGVDIKAQPHYPFAFVQADALNPKHLDAHTFDAIHASPPCQAYTSMSNRWRGKGGMTDQHEDLIGPTRELLEQFGLPYVIENVVGARRQLRSPLTLTGAMFGLGVHRPRLFELSWFTLVHEPMAPPANTVGVYGKAPDGRLLRARADGTEQRAARGLAEGSAAMGIDWMDWRELAESIPPAYTQWIGEQWIAALREAT